MPLMNILGHLVAVISLGRNLTSVRELANAASSCCNVEILRTDRRNAELFFSKPKLRLQTVYLWDDHPENRSAKGLSDVLCTIGQNTGSLREVYICGLKIQGNAILVLADTNPLLEKVDIDIIPPCDVDRLEFFTSAVIEILESLSACKFLKHICLGIKDDEALLGPGIPSVRDACVRWRGCNISIDRARHYRGPKCDGFYEGVVQ